MTVLVPRIFDGYNLRGLIFAYLESRGWEYAAAGTTYSEESWHHPDGTVYVGDHASDGAISYQIEREEGRA